MPNTFLSGDSVTGNSTSFSSRESSNSQLSVLSRTCSATAEVESSFFGGSSSEAGGFSVDSGGAVDMIFGDSVMIDGESNPNACGLLRRQSHDPGMPRHRGTQNHRPSTSSTCAEDIEECYCDVGVHSGHNGDRRRRPRLHYLVERTEPIKEVLKPLTAEELAHLRATSDVPIPSALLTSTSTEETSARPSSDGLSASESHSEGAGPVELAQPIAEIPPPVSPAKVGFALSSSPNNYEDISLNDDAQFSPAAVTPPTPDLLPWSALTSVEPTPISLATPVMLWPLFIHMRRPPLARMPAFLVAT
ncbi:hypothetical protein BD311DRAFT_794356 [Dichomitus squalens]|uniref:Uncharacterized protein n=1 Tax=Dichomitus squalens TaxID=114155 RepID=A0A4Q9MZP1_9APHY|nr:hypothetical protein BD311DRAFT_794356 [Dichomitus squalens]